MEKISSILRHRAATRDTGEMEVLPRSPETRTPKPVRLVDDQLCPMCKNDGWMRPDVPLGHPNFGKIVKCQCRIVSEVRRAHSRTYSWLGADADTVRAMEAMTFLSFDPRGNGESVATAYRRARGYADLLKAQVQGQKNGLFIGPLGVGKTHLACSALNELRAQGIGCLFASGNELFQALFDSFDSDEKEHILKQATEIDVFCLDDLSQMQKREDGSYQKTTLFTIFNQRYIARRPTIITASDDKEWREWLHPAILSRLFGRDRVEAIGMQGRDYRMMGGHANG